MEEIKSSTIYVVATPIGNLSEITKRAVDVLTGVDFICAEDTRHTGILLHHLNIKTPMVAYHKFNERSASETIVRRLRAGESCALVSDAGMPLISDPGSVLLDVARAEGIDITVVSGATALINALVLSGLKTDRFCFIGFLPEKKRAEVLEEYKSLSCTLVFYVAPHDVDGVLSSLYNTLGARRCAAVREISKLYEEAIVFTLGDGTVLKNKGEYVLCVEGAKKAESPLLALSVEEHVLHHMSEGKGRMDAIKQTAKERGLPKSEVYSEMEKSKK